VVARIIVVDDDRSVQTAIRALLERKGFQVVGAGSGSAGLKAVSDAAFDVAIVDIFMAGMDGVETIKALKALAPMMPVIAMSGMRMCSAAELGAAVSLLKPFRPRELITAIETCLGQALREPQETRQETRPETAS
jgi:DNA-binding NtrC family response regulator